MTPAPTPARGPGTSRGTQVSDENKVLPQIVAKLEQLSAGLDETNKYLGEQREVYTDSRTAFTRLLANQESEHERIRARFEDEQRYKHNAHRENMEEVTFSRYNRTQHWQGKLALTRTTNQMLQQTSEATTRQADDIARGLAVGMRQAADISRAANTFERVANTLDRVADPVQSLFGNLTGAMWWLFNWVRYSTLDQR